MDDQERHTEETPPTHANYVVPYDLNDHDDTAYRPGCIISGSILMAMVISVGGIWLSVATFIQNISRGFLSFVEVLFNVHNLVFLIPWLLSMAVTISSVKAKYKPVNIKLINTLATLLFVYCIIIACLIVMIIVSY